MGQPYILTQVRLATMSTALRAEGFRWNVLPDAQEFREDGLKNNPTNFWRYAVEVGVTSAVWYQRQ